jgi:hypothetical protein
MTGRSWLSPPGEAEDRPSNLPTRLADGLGRRSGLAPCYQGACAPSSALWPRNLGPPYRRRGSAGKLGCNPKNAWNPATRLAGVNRLVWNGVLRQTGQKSDVRYRRAKGGGQKWVAEIKGGALQFRFRHRKRCARPVAAGQPRFGTRICRLAGDTCEVSREIQSQRLTAARCRMVCRALFVTLWRDAPLLLWRQCLRPSRSDPGRQSATQRKHRDTRKPFRHCPRRGAQGCAHPRTPRPL